MVELLRMAEGLGAVKTMTKPFGVQDVQVAVAEVLGTELPGSLRNMLAFTAERGGPRAG